MAETRDVHVKDLKLDLANFRTVQQSGEKEAVQAMISISPDYFWALMESLLDDGYLPTENILVLKGGSDNTEFTVKEGNRRVAALKLINGYVSVEGIDVPDSIKDEMAAKSKGWKASNSQVPCAIFEHEDVSIVNRIVAMAHGKGEKAGRDRWNAVATARHNRDINHAKEPALDLLEKYLKNGKNVTARQKERWAGDYPLSVLREAIPKLAERFGVSSAQGLADKYPKVSHRDVLEEILQDVGLKHITFTILRKKDTDVATEYGLSPLAKPEPTSKSKTSSSTPKTSVSTDSKSVGKKAATAVTDPRSVKRKLRHFRPLGPNREKVVSLCDEARQLDLSNTPLAFCFVLRSMFEISAKAYCGDHKASGGPSLTKSDGSDRPLAGVLRAITEDLTKHSSDKAVKRTLHGAMTEIAKKEGILSVTSMNQLVHNPSFSITAGDICTLFGNIFPLLEAMNQ